ncbi:MAG: hypothetical protein COY40_04130 [Alphaproteobacteria bacterium CG_4_10_14_0_8_um_filter_53_9]|nr:MAG: hypothetical protein COY40_04130 [Alphaproteobacteria bacterium CG_4_10_14_0_8_um_filter_53_9]
MRRSKALFTTTLLSGSLGLSACTGAQVSTQLSPYQQQVAQANHQAQNSIIYRAQGVQVAALQNGTRTDAPAGILKQGHILMRRTAAVEKPIPEEELTARIQRIAEETASRTATQTAQNTASQVASQVAQNTLGAAAPQILAAADERIQSVARTLQQQRSEELAQTEARLKAIGDSQKAETQKNIAAQAQKLEKLEGETQIRLAAIKDYTQQGVQIAELKATQNAEATARKYTEQAESTARQVAESAEAKAKTFVVDELSVRERTSQSRMGELLAQTQANQSVLLAQIDTLRANLAGQIQTSQAQTSEKIAMARAEQAGKFAQAQTQTQSQIEKTQAQLSQLAAQTTQALEDVKAHQQTMAQASKDYARAEALAAQLEAQKTAIQQAQSNATKAEANAKEYATMQLALAEERRAASQADVARNLADIKTAQENQAQLSAQAIKAVEEGLKTYADQQLADVAQNVSAALETTAEIASRSTESLAQETSLKLAKVRAEAANRAEQTAQSLSHSFATQLQEAMAQNKAEELTPDQVLTLAQGAVNDATPKLRAIALQSLADSQDYIRTIAQESLTDETDTQVQEALEKAAKNVITKDDQVVFAIRQALTKPAAGVEPSAGGAEPRTVLGNGHALSPEIITAQTLIDPARLGIAAIGGMAGIEPGAGEVPTHLASLNSGQIGMGNPRYRQDWIDLKRYRVVLHEDSRSLQSIMAKIVNEAEPYTGPWEVKWKISRENEDILSEKFSLDAETTFGEFVTYLSQYIMNERGLKLSFNLFDAERILVISD